MYDSFTAQLAGLDLTGFSVQPAPFNETDFPAEEASEQTLAAVWSDLFALFADTALEADAEDIAWGFVNLFHRAATRKSAQVDRASDEIRALLSAADGSEVHSSNLEEQVERAQAAEASMLAFEHKRNEQMLAMAPRYVIAFPGNGVTERLVIEAKARRVTVVDRRGPLGTKPGAG